MGDINLRCVGYKLAYNTRVNAWLPWRAQLAANRRNINTVVAQAKAASPQSTVNMFERPKLTQPAITNSQAARQYLWLMFTP